MKKFLFVIACVALFVSSCSRTEQEPKTFYDEAVLNLKNAVRFKDGMLLQNLDTIFTATKDKTDTIIMIGLKFDLVYNSQNTIPYEYIYQNIDNAKKELLIPVTTEERIEKKAKELQEKTGGNYHDIIIMYSAGILAFNGKDL